MIETATGYYQRARLVQQSATGRIYLATVPIGKQVSLFLDTDLTLTDKSGQRVDSGRPGKAVPPRSDLTDASEDLTVE